MVDFTYSLPTNIIFGKGVQLKAGEETARYSKNVLLHYGGSSVKATGLYDAVTDSLQKAGVRVTDLGGVRPNPRLGLVQQGIKLCRDEGIDFILAVGGGSAIDSAKAIAAGVPYAGDVWDFYTGKAMPKAALGLGVVLTIPAAGSETGSGTVLTKEEGLEKRSFGSELIFPKFALMNPELCYTLPPATAAAGGADIYAHLLERYFSADKNNDLSDRLCEGAMQTVLEFVPRAVGRPPQYEVWAEVMWTASVAHNGLLGKGRMEDWASHGIGHELSALYDIAHGASLAIVFPAWMKYVYKENPARFVQYAVRVFGVNKSFDDEEGIILEGIRRTEAFFASLGLATRLAQAGIAADRFEEMAKKATTDGPLGAFKKLDAEDVVKIYELAK